MVNEAAHLAGAKRLKIPGNGDLHAKNAAILEGRQGGWAVLRGTLRELRFRRGELAGSG